MIEPADAARQYEVLAGECCSALGEDHEQTIRCRAEVARWLSAAGEPAAAADLAGALLTNMTTRYRSTTSAIFRVRYQRAHYLTNPGQYQAALSQWHDLADMAAAIFGRLYSISLSVRVDQAWRWGESGNPAEATAMLQSVLADAVPGRSEVGSTRRRVA